MKLTLTYLVSIPEALVTCCTIHSTTLFVLRDVVENILLSSTVEFPADSSVFIVQIRQWRQGFDYTLHLS